MLSKLVRDSIELAERKLEQNSNETRTTLERGTSKAWQEHLLKAARTHRMHQLE
jgi:hypothetical protein